MLTVTDNGCGWRASVLERIFEPFYSTKGDGKGPDWAWQQYIVSSSSTAATSGSTGEAGKGTSFRSNLRQVEKTTDMHANIQPQELPSSMETDLCVEDEDAVRQFTGANSKIAELLRVDRRAVFAG